MLPWKLRKRQILPVNQNFSSLYFPRDKFVSCNLSLAMFWQITKSHELPKLCSATLNVFKNCLVEHGLNFLSSIRASN